MSTAPILLDQLRTAAGKDLEGFRRAFGGPPERGGIAMFLSENWVIYI
jgi:hypothetical protein